MPKTVEYIGNVHRWPELAVTGRQSVWIPGQAEQRSDAEAAQLLATGLFSDIDATQLPEQKVAAISALVSRAGIVASDTGSAWTGAPSLLSFSAVLDSGTTTAVLLEVRNAAGTVATAATITADTVAQELRQALLLRQNSEYRFRRVSGTGTVTITV